MPRFAWKAVDAAGNTVSGVSAADSPRDLAKRLREQGRSVLSVSRRKWPPTNFHIEGVRRRDIIDLTYKIVPLVSGALPLNRVLDILRSEVKKFRVKNALIGVRADINGGLRLSEALGKHPDIFGTAYVSAVRAGEQSGQLPQALAMMGAFLEWLDDVVKQLWAIVLYPILVLAALLALSFVLAFYAIPTFLNLYERLDVRIDIPLPTRMVFAYSRFMTAYWPHLLAGAGALALTVALRNRVPGMRYFLHSLALKVPFWGEIERKMQSLQFCKFFGLLYQNGVGVKQGIKESQGVLTNAVMRQAVGYVSRRLEEGVPLAEAFETSGQFPPLVSEQLRVGEESGDIGGALEYIMRYYEAELNYSIQRFTTFLRPFLVLVLASVLLTLALSFYLPLFEIANLIETQR